MSVCRHGWLVPATSSPRFHIGHGFVVLIETRFVMYALLIVVFLFVVCISCQPPFRIRESSHTFFAHLVQEILDVAALTDLFEQLRRRVEHKAKSAGWHVPFSVDTTSKVGFF